MAENRLDSLKWQRPSKCGVGLCIEVARSGGHVYMRDTRRPTQVIFMKKEAFAALREGIKAGEFDPI